MSPKQKKLPKHKIKRRSAKNICPNCGLQMKAEYRFCPQCGQENHDFNVSMTHLMAEAIEGFLHFDSKSFHTLRTLLFKPGFLTSEFIQGRRNQYVPPVRLYIFISFLFFLLLALPAGKENRSDKENSQNLSQDFSITFYGINSLDLRGMKQAQLDSVMQVHQIKPTVINRYSIKQMARISSGNREEFIHVLRKAVSYMMFVLMPVFGFFVYILHRKKEKWYIRTLVFSVHFHCFIFLTLIVCLLINRLVNIPGLFLIPTVIFPVYLFLALRHLYGTSRCMTFLRIMIITLLQAVSMVVLFLVTMFISLFVF
jgi:hypothetical protein